MTLIAVTTHYTTSTTLTAWPDGSTSNGVLLTESPTGRYTGTLDDSYGTVWYAFVGASAPTTWDSGASGGPVRVFDLREGTNVGAAVIFSGTQPNRVNDTTLTLFKDEARPITVTLTTGAFAGLTLRFCVENRERVDVLVIEDASIARTATTFTVTVPTAITANIGNYSWSLRDITGGINDVLLLGVLSVQHAANKDAVAA